MCHGTRVEARDSFLGILSPTMWGSGIELRLSGLVKAANAQTAPPGPLNISSAVNPDSTWSLMV